MKLPIFTVAPKLEIAIVRTVWRTCFPLASLILCCCASLGFSIFSGSLGTKFSDKTVANFAARKSSGFNRTPMYGWGIGTGAGDGGMVTIWTSIPKTGSSCLEIGKHAIPLMPKPSIIGINAEPIKSFTAPVITPNTFMLVSTAFNAKEVFFVELLKFELFEVIWAFSIFVFMPSICFPVESATCWLTFSW